MSSATVALHEARILDRLSTKSMKSTISLLLLHGVAFLGLAIFFAAGTSFTGIDRILAYGGEVMGGCIGLYLIFQGLSRYFPIGRKSEK